MSNRLLSTLLTWIVITAPICAYADTPAKLVSKGNAAYLSGSYDEALSAYEEATVDLPESPHIYFNKGAVLYQKGDYAEAVEAFETAALKSKDIVLESRSKYNLGNCAFREAERQQDSDLNKALDACTKSIQHYQEALELDPELHEAAENIEVVRLMMKALIDEINKQKEAQKQQQEKMKRSAEKLKELIGRQQDALDRNQQLEHEKNRKGNSRELQDDVRDLAETQQDIQEETRDLAKNMPKSGNPNGSPSESPAEKHMKNAAKEQQAATGNLEQNNTSEARTNQEKALEELNNALAALSEGQKCGDPGQQQQQGEEQTQQSAPSTDQGNQDSEGREEQAGMSRLADDAHDILNEEKENKKQRRIQAPGSYKNVDKDW